jgi:enamine deaminase RidA (YjgF/YER057c/UK114 family)
LASVAATAVTGYREGEVTGVAAAQVATAEVAMEMVGDVTEMVEVVMATVEAATATVAVAMARVVEEMVMVAAVREAV